MKTAWLLLLATAPAFAFPVWTHAPMTKAQQAQVTEAVTHDLRDPGSAQLRGLVRLVSDQGGEAYCGEVNAKNAYGGYVGFVQFYYNPKILDHVLRADGDGADPRMVDAMCNH